MNCCPAASDLQPPQPYRGQAAAPHLQKLTVFCDFDGPLVDVSHRYYSTYQLGLADTQEIYQEQGEILHLQVLTKEQFWQMKQDRVPDVEIAMRSGLQGEQINVFLQRVVSIVNQPALLQKDKMQPGVNWALALLHSQGIKLVLVTLRCQSQALQILQNHGLARLFSGIYGTQDSHAAYQNYAEVKTQLLTTAIAEHCSPWQTADDCWMVGDTEADILAGQALSIPTIALTCGIRSPQRLRQFQPTRIHSDLLSVAHYLLGVSHHSLVNRQ
ncbi:HAD family hydrolase [Coleofasciculus sp. FACHB-64]|uniref:HAD family hydrolase n=1 Tax=Cyanophyceae TaxID=3028117 RepID=UPI0016821649|nr:MULTISPECIES: HAD family hydrolase [unclassified Coleofasciculus]MBD1841748.1 HAD family hydrolase [Coleofasciculus sp. FACHB-501]MBD1881291.1 HAD family hydrolase [Coleofasciculus sp. FACHB-T130]MBD1892593.1 HAD family hydrolase [Coleofasciculus sp. FACHB-SPT9]MBD1893367.1 HAD family hydrolase [Coleofasciculus sp. FACHB-129]MBD1902682.1 HAD family hydrolase [Coleofasciculus sp. FACHB-125]